MIQPRVVGDDHFSEPVGDDLVSEGVDVTAVIDVERVGFVDEDARQIDEMHVVRA